MEGSLEDGRVRLEDHFEGGSDLIFLGREAIQEMEVVIGAPARDPSLALASSWISTRRSGPMW